MLLTRVLRRRLYTPSTARTSRKKFRKISRKTPETLSELCMEFPSRVPLGSPKPYHSRHLRLPEHFRNSLPLSKAGDASFLEVVPERASQCCCHGMPSSTEGISEQRVLKLQRCLVLPLAQCFVLRSETCRGSSFLRNIDTEYDRAKVPPCNGNDPLSPLVV